MNKQFPKRYGQVFLKDRNIARYESTLFELDESSSILEIGPGEGALTEFLLKPGSIVTVIEPDHQYVDFLQVKFRESIENGHLKIVKADFLQIAGGTYDAIFGNIPYHISSEILFSLQRFTFKKCVLMLQLEFARRLLARTGSKDYSRLSVNTQLRYSPHIEKVVNRNCFSPVPNVDSAIVSLVPLKVFSERDIERADEVFRKLFSSRRKKIGTIYRNCPGNFRDMRVEELSPEEILDLSLKLL